jgi:hypothetical protein
MVGIKQNSSFLDVSFNWINLNFYCYRIFYKIFIHRRKNKMSKKKQEKPIVKTKEKFEQFDFSNLVQTLPARYSIDNKNAVYVGINKGYAKTNNNPKICVRITKDIIQELGWKRKDKIAVFHDKDNLRKLFFFISGSGFTFVDHDTLGQFEFLWKQNIQLELRNSCCIPHEIINTKECKILTVTI